MRRLLEAAFPRHGRARLQVLSDLHLEVGQQYGSFRFPATAPLLLLAGDVGRLVDYDGYLAFLRGLSGRYRAVLLVLGNHEFYGLDHAAGLARARCLASEPALAGSVILLHRRRWDDPDSGLTVLGCTLWSRVPEPSRAAVAARVKDFRSISGWTVDTHNQVHADEVVWLRSEAERLSAEEGGGGKRQLLVATHHAPCLRGTSHPDHADNPWVSAFATDLLAGWHGHAVKVWVFGHTHYSTDFSLPGGTRLVANQRGYVLLGATSQPDARGFDASMAITLKQ